MKTIEVQEFARYGSQRLLLGLFIPDAPVPSGGYSLVMWVVGGDWRHCDRKCVPAFLTKYGFAVASIDYPTCVSSVAKTPANIHDSLRLCVRVVTDQNCQRNSYKAV